MSGNDFLKNRVHFAHRAKLRVNQVNDAVHTLSIK